MPDDARACNRASTYIILQREQTVWPAQGEPGEVEDGSMSSGSSDWGWLKLAVVVSAIALDGQTGYLLITLLSKPSGPPPAADRPLVPPHDVSSWNSLPVQASRTEPFQTACTEIVREITGQG